MGRGDIPSHGEGPAQPDIHLARSAFAVRSTTSFGVAATVFASSCKYSPLAGSNSDFDWLISARNSGSRVVAVKASRSAFTRSAGMPGVARIERLTAAELV